MKKIHLCGGEKMHKKKNWVLRITGITLLFTLLTVSLLGGTLAKYVASVSGSDTARVALFDYETTVGGTALTSTTATINVFNTVADAQVAGGTTSNSKNGVTLVAPGTTGTFDIIATNKSEVDVVVTFAIEETKTASIPLIYEVVDLAGVSLFYSNEYSGLVTITNDENLGSGTIFVTGNTAALAAKIGEHTTVLKNTVDAVGLNYTKTINIKWYWPFEVDGAKDVIDTGFGLVGIDTVSFKITATFTQLD